MSQNDELIIALKKQIEEKETKIEKGKRFSPVTNCSIDLAGVRYNLNTLNEDQIISLMVDLNVLNNSAKELGLEKEYKLSGFSIDDWMTDLKAKKETLGRKKEEQKLQVLKNRLHELLSSDKKIELELEEIKKSLL